MKRIIPIIIAAAFFTAACTATESDSTPTSTSTTSTSNRPVTTSTTTTTTPVDFAAIQCLSDVAEMGTDAESLLVRYNAVASNVTVQSVRSLVRDTKTYIAKARLVVARCGKYAPAEGKSLEYSLDELEDNNNELEDLINQLD